MHIIMLVLGSLLTLIGIWFIVGVFLSGGSGIDMPLAVESLVIPIALTGIGIGATIIGVKPKSKVKPPNSQGNVNQS
jgi:hypothetical protein